MITENLSTLTIHKLTQAQYDRELAAGNIDESVFYLTPDSDDITRAIESIISNTIDLTVNYTDGTSDTYHLIKTGE